MKKATKPATKGAAGKPAAKPAAKPAGRKPIYVTDPNNKRLKSYQDSSKTYEMFGDFKKEIVSSFKSSKSEQDFVNKRESILNKYKKRGFNTKLLKHTDILELEKKIGNDEMRLLSSFAKKPVQPVILEKKATKANVAPKGLKMPSPSIKVQKTVKMPSGIRNIKYDTQKGTVLVNLDGTEKAMDRKDFDKWVNKPENRKMFNEYRSKKAKK